jgi:serine/threonine protein kinase
MNALNKNCDPACSMNVTVASFRTRTLLSQAIDAMKSRSSSRKIARLRVAFGAIRITSNADDETEAFDTIRIISDVDDEKEAFDAIRIVSDADDEKEHANDRQIISDQPPSFGLSVLHSITRAKLDLQFCQLHNLEYLTDGGNSWIHTAVFQGASVVVKMIKPECQNVEMVINEIERELDVLSRLNHANIVNLIGAGRTSRGARFVVLEWLGGGTLKQMLAYDNPIRDRRHRFWRRKSDSFLDALRIARSIAEAMKYCHEVAIPGCVVLHRDLKPDNIGERIVCVVLSMYNLEPLYSYHFLTSAFFDNRLYTGWHSQALRLWSCENCGECMCGY